MTGRGLKPDQRTQILSDEGIDGLPALAVGSEADLICTLEETSLATWKTKTDALPVPGAGRIGAEAKPRNS